jgi:hypothetical protein
MLGQQIGQTDNLETKRRTGHRKEGKNNKAT